MRHNAIKTYDKKRALLDSDKGVVNGVASLGADGKVPAAQIPTEQLPTGITAAEARRIAKKQALIFG